MNLKNYTSTVAAEISIARLERKLVSMKNGQTVFNNMIETNFKALN